MGWAHFAPAALASSLRSFRPDVTLDADDSDRTAAQVANAEEMESHRLLASASHLRTTFCNETDGLLQLASQLRSSASSGLQRASASSSPSIAILLVLQLLQSLLTERGNGGSRPSPACQKLAQSGLLPTAVSEAVTKMRSLCTQAPISAATSKTRSAKADFYTTTALLVEMLSDEQRSGFDEPNLVRYLESVQTQLIKEAQAAGSQIETAQMRAITLRKKVDAALALEDDKDQSKKLTKLREQLKDATSRGSFPGSDELWRLRILVASNLARTSGRSMDTSRDAIAAEWHRASKPAPSTSTKKLPGCHPRAVCGQAFLDWLDNGVAGSPTASRKEMKASFRYSSEQYRWAVRETASLLSRSHNASVAGVEAVQQYRQDAHDLCVLRYVRLSRPLGKQEDTISWLLQSSFASHQAWLDVISELQGEGEARDTERTQKDAQQWTRSSPSCCRPKRRTSRCGSLIFAAWPAQT